MEPVALRQLLQKHKQLLMGLPTTLNVIFPQRHDPRIAGAVEIESDIL